MKSKTITEKPILNNKVLVVNINFEDGNRKTWTLKPVEKGYYLEVKAIDPEKISTFSEAARVLIEPAKEFSQRKWESFNEKALLPLIRLAATKINLTI